MAKSNAVWGIDIGQSGLKALRCARGEGDSIVVDRYDFIEYSKILSAADADPEAIVSESLEQFLSRNQVTGDSVAISVPGQAGLSRFFKPPPVEARKMPDIVKFEVSQQIPFPIEDVIWDWQQLGGSTDDDGRTVDAEIGLFAMKRDAVFRALQPFRDAGVEVDVVQLSPLSIFNVICHDYIDELPSPEDFDPEDPPESIVMMSMGTDTTDLIVTNGMKLWMRNIPIGGNHFTKQLSREMKLTQAKAEHLKRNAKMAENPKVVFRAMRPVFNDLVNEVQRSLNFFEGMDKNATISEMVLMGNAAKLPGLTQYLGKQLELKVSRASQFKNLSGDDVISQSSFASNALSFAPCYGLCLQGLGHGNIKTNLLPRELMVERVIRAKKPWILAAVSLLLLGCSLGLFYKSLAAAQVSPDYELDGVTWKSGESAAARESANSRNFKNEDTTQKELLDKFKVISGELTASIADRSSWIEVYSGLYQALPKDPAIQQALQESNTESVDPKEFPFAGRAEMYIDHIETVYFQDLGEWHKKIEKIYNSQNGDLGAADATAAPAVEVPPSTPEALPGVGGGGGVLATKPGWVIEIQAHHFHNEDPITSQLNFVRQTILDKLANGSLELPEGEFTYEDLGISFPTVVRRSAELKRKYIVLDTEGNGSGTNGTSRDFDDGLSSGGLRNGTNGSGLVDNENVFEAKEFSFVIQMAWIPRSVAERIEARKVRLEAAAAAEAAKAQAAGQNLNP